MNRKTYIHEKLAEECMEVGQMVMKCNHFGMDGVFNELTNREKLHKELDDLMAAIEMMNEECDLQYTPNRTNIDNKKTKVEYYYQFTKISK